MKTKSQVIGKVYTYRRKILGGVEKKEYILALRTRTMCSLQWPASTVLVL